MTDETQQETIATKLPLKFLTGSFGRYEPNCEMSKSIVRVAKRKTLRKEEMLILSDEGGFDIEVE